MIWDGFAVSTAGVERYCVWYHSAGARWNLIPLGTTPLGLAGTSFRFVPPFRPSTRGTKPNRVPAVVPNAMAFQPPPRPRYQTEWRSIVQRD